VRFGLRKLILLVMLIGAGLGWTVRFVRSTRMQQEAAAAIQAAGGGITYDVQRPVGPRSLARALLPRWLGDRVGWCYFGDAVAVRNLHAATDAALAHLAILDRLESADFSFCRAADNGLMHMAGIASPLPCLGIDDERDDLALAGGHGHAGWEGRANSPARCDTRLARAERLRPSPPSCNLRRDFS
jgi:hypothetical protein